MPDVYSIEISMDDDTLEQLKDGKFNLYAFRSVNGPSSGKPVVWKVMNYNMLLNKITIEWTVQYGAFISTEQNVAGTVLKSRTDKPISLDQKMLVDSNGHISVVPGVKNTITIDDEYSVKYTCGISEYNNGAFNPLCSFDVNPTYSDMITPIQEVAVMFATDIIKTATVWERSVGPGIVMDVTNYDNLTRLVTYSIPDGWHPVTTDGVKFFKSGDDLNPLLINPSQTKFLMSAYLAKNRVLL